ncbi:uncharacterized protein LOC129578808 isoform X2 [Sitodiplosis mosellana]|uniref:uncharacterized protein LOC129578808 isoform X2 n=1 Tax=Sitodiplosis mosellana TaxID=263140 RepID=UPI0024452587|nr:uncharacterized protein LOC129578808 isoform X2 [Sitodiplosis mosellana]
MLNQISEIIPFLEKSLNATILDYSAAPLTARGDNFGSTILAINIKVKLNTINDLLGEVKIIQLAVKFPVTNDILTAIFEPTITCVKENSFYVEIVPALFQFQRECGINENDLIDIFIQCYGARNSLDSIADQNALLVLENIKSRGFKIGDRANGFNMRDAEVVLENMAKFHAVPIALRLLRPKIFDEKIRPYLQPTKIFGQIDTDGEITRSLSASVDKVSGLDENLRQKVLNQLKQCSDWRHQNLPAQDTPYTGISHRDLWTNNIMFTCDSTGRIDKVKFCDYQLMTYDSFANDLVFFVFSSINGSNRKGNIEHFFQYYHKHLYQTLAMLNCPLDDYTYEKCRSEIESRAKYELEHILSMLRVILAEKQTKPGELSEDFFFRDNFVGPNFYNVLLDLLNEFEQLNFI